MSEDGLASILDKNIPAIEIVFNRFIFPTKAQLF